MFAQGFDRTLDVVVNRSEKGKYSSRWLMGTDRRLERKVYNRSFTYQYFDSLGMQGAKALKYLAEWKQRRQYLQNLN